MTDKIRLIVLSFLTLFVELALIRWAGANVVYLSYFSNFILLGSFLGIGIGFLRARAKRDLFGWAPVALTALVAFVTLFPVEVDRSGSELIFFGASTTGLPMWVLLPVVFLLSALVLALIAEGTARVFIRFEPLQAYRLDIIGALAGIAAFSALSFLRAPPVAWGSVAGACFVAVMAPRIRAYQIVAVGALIIILAQESMLPGLSWSPYYKVSALPGVDRPTGQPFHAVDVNGIPHQAVMATELRDELEPAYRLPHQLSGEDADDVLIIGAGSGSDVAIALEYGARRVDAVEIDPRLFELGLELHPDRPYQDPRVNVVIDDGRAFLERTSATYDLILFALPDSLTLVSGQSALRLESYLFTREAFAAARRHLKPGGVFAMYNYYRERWLVDRLAGTLGEEFEQEPCVGQAPRQGGLAVLLATDDPAAIECKQAWSPAGAVAEPSTDDHPFVYLRGRSIPGFYLLALGLILLAALIAVRGAGGPLRTGARYLDLFFMGAAFLLLETKNVVQFALLFGTTWFVNALVFAGVLVSVLAAIEVARRWRLDLRFLYVALFVALGVAFVVPQQELLGLALPIRFVTATLLAFTPIFIANIIFAERFAEVGDSATAFAANLLGAMVGGVIEYLALVTGYRFLLIVVAGFYALAFLFEQRPAMRGASPPGPVGAAVGAAPPTR